MPVLSRTPEGPGFRRAGHREGREKRPALVAGRTPIGRPSGATGPYWILYEGTPPELPRTAEEAFLTLRIGGLGETLPIFGSERGAASFARGMFGGRFGLKSLFVPRMRLVSALLGPLAGVDRVALDPLPQPYLAATAEHAGLRAGTFIDLVLGRGRDWARRTES